MKSKTRKETPVVRLEWREPAPGYWAARVGACTLVVRIVEGQFYGWVIVRAMQTFHNKRGVKAGMARAERNLERMLKTALRAFTANDKVMVHHHRQYSATAGSVLDSPYRPTGDRQWTPLKTS
jgi:hypothetical protein